MTHRLPRTARAVSLLTALLLPGCSSNSENSTTLAADVQVVSGASLLGFQAFSPDTFTVDLGTASSIAVSWRNDDGVVHTVTDTAAIPTFNTGNILLGDTAVVVFGAPGSYGYQCSIHNGMQGLVIVTDTVP